MRVESQLRVITEEGEDEVEGIGDAVGEATEDEDGDTEEEGEHLTLAGELEMSHAESKQPTMLPKRTTMSMVQSPLRRMKPAVPV